MLGHRGVLRVCMNVFFYCVLGYNCREVELWACSFMIIVCPGNVGVCWVTTISARLHCDRSESVD